jgi:hypothetical protein
MPWERTGRQAPTSLRRTSIPVVGEDQEIVGLTRLLEQLPQECRIFHVR